MTNKPNPSLELPPLALPLCMGELWMVSLSSRRWNIEYEIKTYLLLRSIDIGRRNKSRGFC